MNQDSVFPFGSCPNCGSEVPEGANFCPCCGEAAVSRHRLENLEPDKDVVPTEHPKKFPHIYVIPTSYLVFLPVLAYLVMTNPEVWPATGETFDTYMSLLTYDKFWWLYVFLGGGWTYLVYGIIHIKKVIRTIGRFFVELWNMVVVGVVTLFSLVIGLAYYALLTFVGMGILGLLWFGIKQLG